MTACKLQHYTVTNTWQFDCGWMHDIMIFITNNNNNKRQFVRRRNMSVGHYKGALQTKWERSS